MKRDQSGTFLSAVFVDYDNIYLSLKRKSDEAAKRFARDAAVWIKEIETGRLITPTNGPGQDTPRRIVMNRCYGNPVPRRNTSDNSTDMSSFPFVRHHYLRAGFEIVDCPPLTAQLKNSSDIRMVMDIRDFLTHPTYFDEFIILSGDADFTPVLHRLRAHARRTVIFANDYTAAPYTAISDGEIRESDLISLLVDGRVASDPAALETSSQQDAPSLDAIRRDILADVAAAVRAANAPVPLEVLADRAVRAVGHDKTIGTSWAGAGSFRDLLNQGLSDGLRVSGEPPYVVIDTRRHLVAQSQAVAATSLADLIEVRPERTLAAPVAQPVQAPAAPIAPAAQMPAPTAAPAVSQPALSLQAPQIAAAIANAPLAREIPAPRNLAVPASMTQPPTAQAPPPQAPQIYAPAPVQAAPQLPPASPVPVYQDLPPATSRQRPDYSASPPIQTPAPGPTARAPEPVRVPEPSRAPEPPRAPEPLTQSSIQQSIARIHEACQAPPLAPPEYRVLFEVMAQEIIDNGLIGAQTIVNITQRAQERGLDARRDDVRFILEVVSEADPWFEQGATANLFAGRFRNFVVARCRGQGLNLSADELDLIEAWFAGAASQPAPAAARQMAQPQPTAQPAPQQATAPAPHRSMQSPDPRASYWSLEEGRQHVADQRQAPRAPMMQPQAPAATDQTGDDFPRIVRTRLRG